MSQPNRLPPGYKSVERRVTTIMVAIPVFIVSSYFLYKRANGEQKREIVKLPPLPPLPGEGSR